MDCRRSPGSHHNPQSRNQYKTLGISWMGINWIPPHCTSSRPIMGNPLFICLIHQKGFLSITMDNWYRCSYLWRCSFLGDTFMIPRPLFHFIPWFVISLLIYYFVGPLLFEGTDMFIIILISFLMLIFLFYFTNYLKKMMPIAIIALVMSSSIYYYILM